MEVIESNGRVQYPYEALRALRPFALTKKENPSLADWDCLPDAGENSVIGAISYAISAYYRAAYNVDSMRRENVHEGIPMLDILADVGITMHRDLYISQAESEDSEEITKE